MSEEHSERLTQEALREQEKQRRKETLQSLAEQAASDQTAKDAARTRRAMIAEAQAALRQQRVDRPAAEAEVKDQRTSKARARKAVRDKKISGQEAREAIKARRAELAQKRAGRKQQPPQTS